MCNLGGSAPDRVIVPVDKDADELLRAGVKRAQRSPDEIAQDTNYGMDRTGNLAQSDQSISGDAAQSGQDPAMMKAISNLYQGQAGAQIDKIKGQNGINATFSKADSLRKLSMAALGQQRVETANFERMTQAYNDQEAARSQLVSSIFQVGRQAYVGSRMKQKKTAPNFSDRSGGYDAPQGEQSDYGDQMNMGGE